MWEANSGQQQFNRLPAGTDLYNIIPNNWDNCQYTSICLASTCNYRAQFEGTASICGGPGPFPVITDSSLDPTTTQATKTKVDDVLRGFQRTLYGQVASAFGLASPIQSASLRLTGRKMLLQA